jgi:mRNA interferase MazF
VALFERGEVILAPIKYTDLDVYKVRPVVILSRSNVFGSTGQVILAMITSAKGSAWPFDVAVADWQASGLNGPCVVRMKILTLDERLIIRRVGWIGQQTLMQVSAHVKALLI